MWRLDEAQCGAEVGSPVHRAEDGLTRPGSLGTGTITGAPGGHPKEALVRAPRGTCGSHRSHPWGLEAMLAREWMSKSGRAQPRVQVAIGSKG